MTDHVSKRELRELAGCAAIFLGGCATFALLVFVAFLK